MGNMARLRLKGTISCSSYALDMERIGVKSVVIVNVRDTEEV